MADMSAVRQQIWDDLAQRLPHQRKTQRDKLALLFATMLEVRSGQVMQLTHGLPLETTASQSRFQWTKRFLRNDLVKVDEVMEAVSRAALVTSCEGQEQPVQILEQSTITSKNRHELIMVAWCQSNG